MIFVLVVPEKNTNIAMDKDSNFYDKISYSFRRRILLFSTLVVLLGVTLFMINGCSETSEPPDWGYMYHYYPLQEGHWTIYQVDSVAYNSLLDSVKTYRYYIKEEMGPLFTDLSGNQWTRVKADYSTDTTSGWSPLADYAQRITTQTAERFENNLHFIKMVFPLKNSPCGWATVISITTIILTVIFWAIGNTSTGSSMQAKLYWAILSIQ